MVTSFERPQNHPIYLLDTKMCYAIFFTNGDEYGSHFQNDTFVPTEEDLGGIWDVDFNGLACREGAGAGIWMNSLGIRALRYS